MYRLASTRLPKRVGPLWGDVRRETKVVLRLESTSSRVVEVEEYAGRRSLQRDAPMVGRAVGVCDPRTGCNYRETSRGCYSCPFQKSLILVKIFRQGGHKSRFRYRTGTGLVTEGHSKR